MNNNQQNFGQTGFRDNPFSWPVLCHKVKAMSHVEPTVLLVFWLLCIVGLVTNSAAFFYTVKALRNVQRSLFILLMADSVTSLLG